MFYFLAANDYSKMLIWLVHRQFDKLNITIRCFENTRVKTVSPLIKYMTMYFSSKLCTYRKYLSRDVVMNFCFLIPSSLLVPGGVFRRAWSHVLSFAVYSS